MTNPAPGTVQTINNPDGSTVTITWSPTPLPGDPTQSAGFTELYTPAPGSPLDVAATIQARAQAALTTNATFLAIPSPSQAQAITQVQALTRECNGLIRLLLGQLDSTSGT